jgi:demethylmenaquinone methyltransferase/2-methoxy-6-polyprenyl-1,4-benzoquinol methylase
MSRGFFLLNISQIGYFMQEKTDFGYQQVPWNEKAKRVAAVFHNVAQRYDLMNDCMSFGIHRLWKRFALGLANIRPGDTALDLASGTGDLALRLSALAGKTGQVIAADINDSMLTICRDRLINQGYLPQCVVADAEKLPFPPNSFDIITIAFGLRNVTDKAAALRAMFSALKPGGRMIIVEFSKPVLPLLEKAYDAYSFSLLPFLGKMIADDAESYRYLAESIRRHPDQNTLLKMLEETGFEKADYHNLTGGIVAVHRGYKL